MQARKGAGNLIIVKTRFPLNVQVPFAKKVKLTKLNLTGQEEQEQIPKILSCGKCESDNSVSHNSVSVDMCKEHVSGFHNYKTICMHLKSENMYQISREVYF
ncbi:uncharacterized protein [Eurosta solidaginis]|uniref:uncharacterized protein isoform X1 n=1 Tax=Eurosta solidaginis TaxID=178769 RepID=UPI0035312282